MGYKGKKCFNNGLEDRYFFPGEEPEGFIQGSLNNGHNKGSITYHNPDTDAIIRVKPGDLIPAGFIKGNSPKAIQKQSEAAKLRGSNKNNIKNKKWYNNGITQIRIDSSKEKIPEGFIKGRLPMTEEQRLKIKKVVTGRSVSESTRQKHREFNYARIKEKGAFGLGTTRSAEFKKKQSKILSSKECQLKRYLTCKKNNSFNKSYLEEKCYQELCGIFNVNDVLRQYKDVRYPFLCDFYIKSLDLFIECNFHWTHGKHTFNPDNDLDIQELNRIKNKMIESNFYKVYYNIWTIADPKKIKTAIYNNLNYKTLYNQYDMQLLLNELKGKIVNESKN